MEQAREVRAQAKDKAQAEVRVQGKVRVQAEGEDREWEDPWAAANHPHVLQDTVCVPIAASKRLIRSDSPAANRAARNAGQK